MAVVNKLKFVCRPQLFVSAFSSFYHGIPHHFGDYVFKRTFSGENGSKFLTTLMMDKTSKESHQGKAASRTKMLVWISMAMFLDLLFALV